MAAKNETMSFFGPINYAILPLFALANAGVKLSGGELSELLAHLVGQGFGCYLELDGFFGD